MLIRMAKSQMHETISRHLSENKETLGDIKETGEQIKTTVQANAAKLDILVNQQQYVDDAAKFRKAADTERGKNRRLRRIIRGLTQKMAAAEEERARPGTSQVPADPSSSSSSSSGTSFKAKPARKRGKNPLTEAELRAEVIHVANIAGGKGAGSKTAGSKKRKRDPKR